MDVKDIIRAPKTDISLTEWRSGHITRSQFPLSKAKNKAYKKGPDYSWRVIRFSALGRCFRVLLLLNPGKEIFYQTLGMEVGEDMTVICSHDFHADEPGWHCHVKTGDVDAIPVGITRGPAARRWPRDDTKCSHQNFGVTQSTAAAKAMKFYRIREDGTLPL